MLRSLGHAPDVEHHELVGAKASSVAKRNGVPVQKLERVVKRQPGVLDAEVSEDDRILVQLVTTANQQLLDARHRALASILGHDPAFVKAQSNRLRPDQWRLIGAGIALPILGLIMLTELLGMHGRWIGALALPGVVVGGLQMFKEASKDWAWSVRLVAFQRLIGFDGDDFASDDFLHLLRITAFFRYAASLHNEVTRIIKQLIVVMIVVNLYSLMTFRIVKIDRFEFPMI